MLEKPRLVIEVGEGTTEHTEDPTLLLSPSPAVQQAAVERQIVKVALHAPELNIGNPGQDVGGVLLSVGEQRLAGVQQAQLDARGARLFEQVLDQAHFERCFTGPQRDDVETNRTRVGNDAPRGFGQRRAGAQSCGDRGLLAQCQVSGGTLVI